MSARSWMPLYVGDYRADTTHLGAAQHGAYLLLIMHYWQQGGLPEDDEQLARIACMSLAEWRRHRPVIRSFFGEGWRHDRIDHEISLATDRYERRAKAGRKGNETRWSGRNAIALGSQSQPQSHPLRGSPSQEEQTSPVGHCRTPARSPGRGRLAVVARGGLADEEPNR